jgi:DNA recombination protein RmuC
MEPTLLEIGLFLLSVNLALLVVLLRSNSSRSLASTLTELLHGQERQDRLFQDGLRQGRMEGAAVASEQRQEISKTLWTFSEGISRKLDSGRDATDQTLRFVAQSAMQQQNDFRDEVTKAVTQMRSSVESRLADLQAEGSIQLETIRDRVEQRLRDVSSDLTTAVDQLSGRTTASVEKLKDGVEARLISIESENRTKLEEMRKTVDDKLELQFDRSFQSVSEGLAKVQNGLGEMRDLASKVGDLKKLISNIPARGTWSEVLVGNLLEQILTPDQYSENVRTNPDSDERVEFAVRLPGKETSGHPVWLPIDCKFPLEDHQRLLEAEERSDNEAIKQCGNRLEDIVVAQAKNIRRKYVNPPYTTDFAILFLRTEGLFAEVLQRPGIHDRVQQEQIVLAGPSTLSAILNSLSMGFRSVAIEQRSAEVWEVLGAVKTEFGRFEEAIELVGKKLHQASNKLGDVRTRQRVLISKLRDVEDLPSADTARLLQLAPLSSPLIADDEDESRESVGIQGESGAA